MVIFEQNGMRISLILPTVVRVERENFTDLPTQTVICRDFGNIDYKLVEEKNVIRVRTASAEFILGKKTGELVSAILADGSRVKPCEEDILPGTYRTLDNANGGVKLERGITSRSGVSFLDDSQSLLLDTDGNILPREKCSDIYYFASGRDYLAQLRDFFKLTGEVPLIPKFALGNWWSRYRAYTQEEYRALMQTFIDKKLPITVATIDMDWHWTDVVKRFGPDAKPAPARSVEESFYNMALPGWTGYSWNTELFPDHIELLNWLHEKGFKVPLNIHPSQGVRFFENVYTDMCHALGRDPEKKEPILFDPTDREFMRAYFDVLHRPLEEEGVDFWWIDWQQGKNTKIPGLDPLWALNHYHTADSARDGCRPLILSRYAGLGSHRYPLGFSGDTIVTWESLDFQPYFTNSAANAGYTWWSHDIGGHTHGVQNDVLYLRWLQYGVFSPINRLHSSNSEYMGKEPWKRCYAVEMVAENFLRLRHKLIPYLYTAAYRTHKDGEPICQPMYYRYDCPEAYRVKNQYIFGGQLIVAPITEPLDSRLHLACVEVWLPEGRWTDIFNGRVYEGGRMVKMYRDIDSIPVLAPAGAILPMYQGADTNDLSLDQPLELHVWRGNGSYELYEDDGETTAYKKGKYAITSFRLCESEDTLRLEITPPKDSFGLLPKEREIYVKFRDIDREDMRIVLSDEPVVVEISGIRSRKTATKEEMRVNLITRVQGSNTKKDFYFGKRVPRFISEALSELDAMIFNP